MRLQKFSLVVLIFCKSILFSQTPVPNPVKNDFSGTLSFLASDWMEGREATSKGGFKAADYIASMMELYQLTSYNNQSQTKNKTFFQDFKIRRHTVEAVSLTINNGTTTTIVLSPKTEYQVTPVNESLKKETSIVFAGYGLSLPKENYDDYKKITVKDKVVLILKGYPGYKDTTSIGYKKFKKRFPEENNLEETKIQNAIQQGATAILFLDADGDFKPNSTDDAIFHSLEKPTSLSVPIFRLSASATQFFLAGTSIRLSETEKKAAQKLETSSSLLPNKKCHFSIELKSETLPVRNVIGMIPGKDTSKTIIIGAHYDHLGIKNDSIYNGADDNASGASGMLALAKNWSESKIQPPYNMVFASWTAEEMGLLGSEYFVDHFDLSKQKILLCVNMDMISRSAPEDQKQRILSIGTQKEDENLRKIATACNQNLPNPFELDLWETNGHTGSDYASFTAKGIPIMTFFSGFHKDYHSPRDRAESVDLNKEKDVLSIVNTSILKFIETHSTTK
ncbi:M20/M25/M40 family metallo-hydrolase [Flavobacterium poyangense]|uniref:M20/M25/M40 family metallo-hydrolase n=1 Tax=Flavobacterium poyangense TaxID=2204302 RepID=UPI00142443D1|nr:M20/M25/M40 family metallo-hydrolase [Flavobacterium sp. JXAS1]